MIKIQVSCGNQTEKRDVSEILIALHSKGHQCRSKIPNKQGKYQRVYIEAYKDYRPKAE